MSDYYSILGVSRSATEQEIKRTYRKLAQKHHPDKNKGSKESEEKFKEINEAYSVLSDPEKRKIYDQYGKDGLNNQGGFGGGFNGFNGGGFEDIFNSFFGGSRGERQPQGPAPGEDIRLQINFSLEDYYFGAEREIEYKRLIECEVCHGHGSEDPSNVKTCSTCNGSGYEVISNGFMQIQQPCRTCGSKGKIVTNPCKVCRGKGRVLKTNKHKFVLQKNFRPGLNIRIRDIGNAGEVGAPNGNLIVNLGLIRHELYQIDEGMNLHLTLHIDIVQACLGETITINHFGEELKIKVPAGVANGAKQRVAYKGLDVGNHRADLIITFEIETLQSLNNEQKELLEKLKSVTTDKNRPKSSSFTTKLKNLFKGKK